MKINKYFDYRQYGLIYDDFEKFFGEEVITKEQMVGAFLMLNFVCNNYHVRPMPPSYDPTFGDEKMCVCDHTYYRHFDSHNDMEPIGCKYCPCSTFVGKDTHPQ